jgi:hypothetical protein
VRPGFFPNITHGPAYARSGKKAERHLHGELAIVCLALLGVSEAGVA